MTYPFSFHCLRFINFFFVIILIFYSQMKPFETHLQNFFEHFLVRYAFISAMSSYTRLLSLYNFHQVHDEYIRTCSNFFLMLFFSIFLPLFSVMRFIQSMKRNLHGPFALCCRLILCQQLYHLIHALLLSCRLYRNSRPLTHSHHIFASPIFFQPKPLFAFGTIPPQLANHNT